MMKIITVLNTHGNTECVLDTIDSILSFVGNDILVVIDGAVWRDWGESVVLPAVKMEGFKHGCARSPYRNVALGLKTALDIWADFDWLCFCEYDVLFASTRFKHNLQKAEERKVWMLGNDGHIDQNGLPFIEEMLGGKIKDYYYLLGCCQFYHRDFMEQLQRINFFDRFLHLTNNFESGYMPSYGGYDVSETLYPTLCRYFGGNIGVFASYDEMGHWHGAYQYFPMRWIPSLDPETENFPEASLLHPLKEYDHPIRQYHREKRKNVRV